MVKIALCGAGGRMCQSLAAAINASYQFEVAFGVDPNLPKLDFDVYPSFAQCPKSVDLIIDFSTANAIFDLLDYAVDTGARLVIATTAHTKAQRTAIVQASQKIPIFYASNMSSGVNLLVRLASQCAVAMGEDFDIEIVETHHRNKQDAPSGTALMLASAMQDAMSSSQAQPCKRQIGIHSLRGGCGAGTHEVQLLGKGENIILRHEAQSKDIFAHGALAAAKFLLDKGAGLYDMQDLLAKDRPVDKIFNEEVCLVRIPAITLDKLLGIFERAKSKGLPLGVLSQQLNTDGLLSVCFTLPPNTHADILSSAQVSYTAKNDVAALTCELSAPPAASGVICDILTALNNLNATIFAISKAKNSITCCIAADLAKSAEIALREVFHPSRSL